MSLGNMDARLHQIQALVGLNAAGLGGFASANARQNQGIALVPDLVRDIASQANLPSSMNLLVSLPVINSAASVTVTSSPAKLIAVIVDNNDSARTIIQLFNTTSVTAGTTVELQDLSVGIGVMAAFLFPDCPDFSVALAWEATTAAHGSVRSTAAKVTVAVVYAV
jgi:hypothetical protein